MSDFTSYLQNAILNHVFRHSALSVPAAVFAGLFNGDPRSGGTEVTTTIRPAGRVAITFASPAAGVMSNSSDVDYGNSAGNASVTHVGIYDAASSGNLLAAKSVGSQTIATGAAVKFVAGALTVTLQ
jgi:hypothetical protein